MRTTITAVILFAMLAGPRGYPAAGQDAKPIAPIPSQLTTQQDHRLMMDALEIKSLRPGANGMSSTAPNAANYDESKANPYPKLPDPLVFKNGKRVTTAKDWPRRRAEIVEEFDREVYGRVPKETPKVNWQVSETKNVTIGEVPVVTKKLVGHVDNSA